jgi:hypothetical protein
VAWIICVSKINVHLHNTEVVLIKNIQNILENGVKNIVLTHHVIKWDFLKKQVVDTTKIATNKQVKQIFINYYKNFQILMHGIVYLLGKL